MRGADRQAGRRAGDDQFAHQVDQLIELADLDLDKYLLLHPPLFALFLLVQGGTDHGRRDQLLLNQQRTQGWRWLRRSA